MIEGGSLTEVSRNHSYVTTVGKPLPFGATPTSGGVNFSIYSRHATACTLVLFHTGEREPFTEIPIPADYRLGDVFCVFVEGLDYEKVEYGYRMDGPFDPPAGHRFDPNAILLDPYAKAVGGRSEWGVPFNPDEPFQHRACIVKSGFDWGHDRPLQIPIEDLVIYEMHVRGFTRHPSSGVQHPGTYEGLREKIPYLRELGVNCVELMPIFAFDEFEHSRISSQTGELLLNYWGYSPFAFFAPEAGYAAHRDSAGEINELKQLIKDLHANGIEVLLDVVFNHTAEGNENGPTISFKGIDNEIFYILTPEGYYYNFSGTGNAFNGNHPRVQNFIIDCLRYWVSEFHVDGFRFDLASILTRDIDGMPLPDPPLLRRIVDDPILGRTKLIAEPWDADGLYHLGTFPAYGRWAEWNGFYRDTVRQFLKGDAGKVEWMAKVLMGSHHLYPGRGPIATINFVTAHDGFTLMDLVSYNHKHNEANEEGNRDGTNENYSWNHGEEGETDNPEINALRRRQVKNALTMLLVSQGVPMMLMGDELGRTQHGNNNAYCQDNDISWLDWNLRDQNKDIFRFFQQCIRFRREHPVLRNGYFLRGEDYLDKGSPDIVWHGSKLEKPDWSDDSRELAFFLNGDYAKGGLFTDHHIYVAMNMSHQDDDFELPPLPNGQAWHVFINTGDAQHDIHEVWREPRLDNQEVFHMLARSVIVLVAK